MAPGSDTYDELRRAIDEARRLTGDRTRAEDRGMTGLDSTFSAGEIERSLGRIENSMVTQAEFQPVARIVYGLCALLLTGMIVALVKLVLIK